MTKKVLALISAGVTALSLTACGGGVSVFATTAPASVAGGETKDDEVEALEKDMKTTTLKSTSDQSGKYPQYLAPSEMNDAFYEAISGAYRIKIGPDELLDSQKDVFELVQSDTIQMVMMTNSIVGDVNPDPIVLGPLYAYGSVEHQKKVLTSDILDDIFASIEADNFSVMAASTAEARCIYTDKSVQTPIDLKGYKIRVMESRVYIAILDTMGGVGTPMAQGEVYTAIQQGVINGGENNEITCTDLKHHEVVPYFSYTCHLMVLDPLVTNIATLKGTNEENQQTLKDLHKECAEREFQLWDESLEGTKNTVEEAGVQFIDMGIVPFQEVCQPVIDNVISKSEEVKALCEEIRSLVN